MLSGKSLGENKYFSHHTSPTACATTHPVLPMMIFCVGNEEIFLNYFFLQSSTIAFPGGVILLMLFVIDWIKVAFCVDFLV